MPRPPLLPIVVLVSLLARVSAATAEDGSALYKKHCALCHGPDGKAKTPVARKLGVKDLTVSKTVDEEIARQIREGKRDDKGKQLMPPFAEKLSAEDITALVGTVKGLRPQ